MKKVKNLQRIFWVILLVIGGGIYNQITGQSAQQPEMEQEVEYSMNSREQCQSSYVGEPIDAIDEGNEVGSGLTNDFTFTGMNYIGEVFVAPPTTKPKGGNCGGGNNGAVIGTGTVPPVGGGSAPGVDPKKKLLAVKRTDCDGINTANKVNSNALVQKKIQEIRNKTMEYGTAIMFSDPGSINTVTLGSTISGSENRVQISPAWDQNRGYHTGYIHNHPSGSAPSPADVLGPIHNLNDMMNQASISESQMRYYIENFSSIVVSGDNVYTITIKDVYHYSQMKQAFTPARQLIEKNNYEAMAQEYLKNNKIKSPTPEQLQEAGEFALLKLFDQMIHLNKQKIGEQGKNQSIKRDGQKQLKKSGC
ncbi:hypothetical protein [Sphingobacterium spiritivorum]|uniref:hypothetical protein n=1 Tax=Sphingobacterium spiritivorum TaxID=258 RepID=UPI003DA60540